MLRPPTYECRAHPIREVVLNGMNTNVLRQEMKRNHITENGTSSKSVELSDLSTFSANSFEI